MKVYIVKNQTFYSNGQVIDCVFLDRISAEYFVWNEENKQNKITSTALGKICYSITEREVKIEDFRKEKDFKKFIEERVVDLEKKIESERVCRDSDTKEIEKLKLEVEELNSLNK